MPSAHKELMRICKVLEKHFRDVQDFEFTIEEEKVYMLQTRNGKRTGLAAVRIACEMVKEKLITWKDAIKRIPADDLDQLLAPVFDQSAVKKVKAIAKGLPAGPGAATVKSISMRIVRRPPKERARKSCSCAWKPLRKI